MDITIPIFIILGGTLFYFLSFLSPSTDLVFYGIAATLFLVAGVMGMSGFNDFPIQESNLTISSNLSNNTTSTQIIDQNRYVDTPFLDVLGALFVLLSLYMFVKLTTEFKIKE